MSDGILVVDKPRGMTSHDVVFRARKALKTRDIGHAGTLDPMATGVLVLGVGEGTKLLGYLAADEKAYQATIVLGKTTETLDADGATWDSADVPANVREAVEAYVRDPQHVPDVLRDALAIELLRREQTPPIFSAIHTGGERAYALARKGIDVTLPPRPVVVHEIRFNGAEVAPELSVRVHVRAAKGYYVRSLGRDLGASLGTVAHLSALRRERSGPFDTQVAVALDGIRDAPLVGLAEAACLTLPKIVLDADEARDARHGKRIRTAKLVAAPRGPCAWLDETGRLVAIGETPDDDGGKVLRGFRADG